MTQYVDTVYVVYKNGEYHKTYKTLGHARNAISNSSSRVWDRESRQYVTIDTDWEICEYDIRKNNWELSNENSSVS